MIRTIKVVWYAMAFTLLLINQGFSQNLNFESVKIKHRQVPKQPLDEGIVSYNSLFRPVDLDLTGAQLESMRSKSLVLEGFNYQEENADITIELIVDVLSFNARNVLDKSTTKKEGDKEVKVPAYQYSLRYDYPYKLIVTDNATGQAILENEDILPIEYIFPENGTVSSTQQLNNMYEERKGGLINSIRKAGMDRVLNQSHFIINDQFGYPVIDLSFDMGYVKKYKKYDYSDIYAAFEDMRVGLNQIDEEWYAQEMGNSSLLKARDVFVSLMKEYNPGDKKARINEKIVFMVNHNAAICSFFLKDFSACEEYLAGIGSKAPYKISSNQKFMQDFVDDIEQRYVANNIQYQ